MAAHSEPTASKPAPGSFDAPGASDICGAGWAPMARRRLMAVAVSGFLVSFCYVAADVILPLWATRDLGLQAADWAHVRSLRFAGVLAGVVLLGAVSDRLGPRRGAVLALSAAGVVTGLFWLNSRSVLWLLMPVFGALLSTAMVNLNTLTQAVTPTRQGVANSVYRGVGAAAGIVAPIVATFLANAWGGYPAVFLLLGALTVLGGVVVLAYPMDEPMAPLERPTREFRRFWGVYASALRERALMRYIHVSQLCLNSLACVSGFVAIRLTRELGMSDRSFGVFSTAVGVLTFALIAGAAFCVDRLSLRRVHLAVGLVAAAGTVLMGAAHSLTLTCLGALLAMPLSAMLIVPGSMWVSRAAGGASQTAAFAVHKVVTALYLSAAMFVFGLLERWVGIRGVLLLGGSIGLVTALGFMFLGEPPNLSSPTRASRSGRAMR